MTVCEELRLKIQADSLWGHSKIGYVHNGIIMFCSMYFKMYNKQPNKTVYVTLYPIIQCAQLDLPFPVGLMSWK